MCTNPAVLDGGHGDLEPLVNFDYLLNVPPNQKWQPPGEASLQYYRGECMRGDGGSTGSTSQRSVSKAIRGQTSARPLPTVRELPRA